MSSPEASTYLSRQAARGASQREALAAAKLAEAAARVERSAALRVAGLSTAAEQAELVSRAAADKAAKKALLRERREERRARGAAGGSGSVESADTAGGAEVSAHAAPAEEGAPPCNGVAAPAVPAQLGAARAQTASARARNVAPAAAAEDASEGDPAVGRLVWNHSTHVDGLMPLLLKLLRAEAGVTTAIPGRITAGLAHRAALELEEFAALGAPLCGFSCVARVASSQQEVVLTTCPGVTLAAVVRAYGVARGELRGGGGGGAAARREGAWVEHAANVNRVAGDVVGDAARARAKAAHERGAEAQRAAQTQRDVAAVRKKLANSGAAKEKGYDLEAAAQAWAEQQAGGRGARGKYWGK